MLDGAIVNWGIEGARMQDIRSSRFNVVFISNEISGYMEWLQLGSRKVTHLLSLRRNGGIIHGDLK